MNEEPRINQQQPSDDDLTVLLVQLLYCAADFLSSIPIRNVNSKKYHPPSKYYKNYALVHTF